MNRKYTREWYLDRVAAIRRYLPDCAVTTDLIAGFSGETEEEHAATLSLMREVGYEFAYMFKYSERPGTFASKHLPDDVPDEVKTRRLSEIIALQNELGRRRTAATWGANSRCWWRGVPSARRAAVGPHVAEQGRGLRPRRTRRGRVRARAYHGLLVGHAVR